MTRCGILIAGETFGSAQQHSLLKSAIFTLLLPHSRTITTMTDYHRITAISKMGSYLAERGIAPGVLLRRLGLPKSLLLQDRTWLERGISLLLAEEAARMTGDRLAGIRIVEMTQLSDYGVWGEAITSAPDLRGALTAASQGVHRLETGTRIRLREEGDSALLSFEFVGRLETDPRQHLQGGLFVLRKILDLASEPVSAVARFSFDRQSSGDLEPFFPDGIAFSAERATLVFDRGALKLALARPAAPGDEPAEEDAVWTCAKIVSEMLARERPTVAKVAAKLQLSPRTLQRRLEDWGVGFGELVDQYRYSLARQYLRSGSDSITDIAFRLGYSDVAHFTRAFRRWTGMAPSEAMRDPAFLSKGFVPGLDLRL